MSEDWDVIVVGAGPAGAAAAFDLARANRSVLLVDRSEFPRTKACAGGLTIKALRALRYSVAPVVRHVCHDVVVSLAGRTIRQLRGPGPVVAMTVRAELDEFCLNRTLAEGATFRRVRRIDAIESSLSGVALVTSEGELRARHVVGADGANSRIRKLSGEFPEARLAFALEVCTPLPAGPRPEMEFEFGVVPAGYGWIFPKDDHLNIGLYSIAPEHGITRARLSEYVERRTGQAPSERSVGHAMGIAGRRYVPRHPRVRLAGDAAGLVEPMLGEGLHNAIVSGQAAARAILEASARDELTPEVPRLHDRLLEPIRRDVGLCERAATHFYRRPGVGARALATLPVRYPLMKGFACGLTVDRIRRSLVGLPFRRVAPVTELDASAAGVA